MEELKKSVLQKAFSGELTAAIPHRYVMEEAELLIAAEPEENYIATPVKKKAKNK